MNNQPDPPADAGVRRLLEDVYATAGDEIQCNQAAQQIALAAAAVMTDTAAQERFPRLFAHFQFCPDCREEYELLMAFARAEASDAVPAPRRVPPLPAELRGAGPSLAGRVLQALFPGFTARAPLAAEGALRGGAPLLPVVLAFDDGFTVRLDAERTATGVGFHLLTVAVQSGAASLPTSVELLSGQDPDWDVEDSRPFDSDGAATLLDLPAGAYTLRLLAPGRSYVIAGLVVP